ncbi:protein translocase SEC61 complex subunit gamma [Methanobrevibacter sp.]|uniref:protein translocase SEC61 complex subunit gamma n=1 Tax=Methanobrevibacter sp. TaxID=66852 RepID=UPI00388F44CD
MNVQERFDKFIKDSKRVLKVARKPDTDEYFEFAKITALGILIIGLVGFVVVLIGQLIGL